MQKTEGMQYINRIYNLIRIANRFTAFPWQFYFYLYGMPKIDIGFIV